MLSLLEPAACWFLSTRSFPDRVRSSVALFRLLVRIGLEQGLDWCEISDEAGEDATDGRRSELDRQRDDDRDRGMPSIRASRKTSSQFICVGSAKLGTSVDACTSSSSSE